MRLIVFGVVGLFFGSILGLLMLQGLKLTEPKIYKPGDVFKDCSDCPEMVVIPAGSFMMGHDQPPRHIISGEYISTTPVHRVTIPRPFAMGRYEVTRASHNACRDAERWPGKFRQGVKWIFCLRAAMMPLIGRNHDEAYTAEPHSGFQGEGGFGGDQGRQDAGRVGAAV
ncbi:formylglycine-generating enzyme family protein [Magnetospira thiophila]